MAIHYRGNSTRLALPRFQGERVWIGRPKDQGGAMRTSGNLPREEWYIFNVISVSSVIRTWIFTGFTVLQRGGQHGSILQ